MKKKPSAKVKVYRRNLKKRKMVAAKGARVIRLAPQFEPKRSLTDDPRFAQAVQNYEAGLKSLQEHKFERAKGFFQKVIAGASRELRDRAAVHLNTCNQQLSRNATSFKTPEEHYDFAVSLMNMGEYISAREHLEKIVRQAPKADYGWYGLAVLDCLNGHFEEALKHLREAIRLNPGNRFQARNDSDFKNIFDDPRFTELLYPEGT